MIFITENRHKFLLIIKKINLLGKNKKLQSLMHFWQRTIHMRLNFRYGHLGKRNSILPMVSFFNYPLN
ncbi:hypothetical protein SAMN02745150_00696 [Brevinema andersonii]|uniref:Uncharacterized protein n=1 Tax=Brevinema andersonii TaxID=34097 RepID=A0A1I1DQU4_BREAD|nr:hypothetical protein SAMN02745150_00696 [Brevinema andersonii]